MNYQNYLALLVWERLEIGGVGRKEAIYQVSEAVGKKESAVAKAWSARGFGK